MSTSYNHYSLLCSRLCQRTAQLVRRRGLLSVTVLLLLTLTFGPGSFSYLDTVEGAYTTATTDVDGNAHLASNTVNGTAFYDTAEDSPAAVQQQLGIDPNWKSGVVRKSYALEFDGSNDVVEVPNEGRFNFSRLQAFTIEAWVKVHADTPDGSVLMCRQLPSSPYTGFCLQYRTASNNSFKFQLIGTSATTDLIEVTGSTAINDGKWHHFAAVYNGKSKASGVQYYIDGVADSMVVDYDTLTGSTTSASTLTIGGFYDGTYPLKGCIDEVRVSNISRYSVAFSPSRRFVEDSNTVGLWHFDEGTGQYAYDAGVGVPAVLGNSTAATAEDPTWVTGGNAIMDGFAESESPTDGNRTGAGNVTITSNSSVSNDKAYELRTTTSTGVSFDGVNDYATIANQATYTFSNTTFTVEFWFKTVTTSTSMLVTKGHAQAGWGVFVNNDGRLYGRIKASGGQDVAVRKTNTVVNDGLWHHAAVIFTTSTTVSASNDMTIYLDGGLNQTTRTTQNSSATYGTTTQPLAFAARTNGSGVPENFYSGVLDEVHISSTSRYSDSFTPSRYFTADGSSVGLWHLNEGLGSTTAADAAGTDDTATFLNDQANSPAADGVLAGPTWSNGISTAGAVYYQWRQAGGSWSTSATIPTSDTQLGSEGVYVRFNPGGRYTLNDYFRINSWAVEAFSTSAPARGNRRSFPDKANLIASASGLDMIDATTNKLWMRLPIGANNLAGANATVSVAAKNGRIALASADGLTEIQLDLDCAQRYTTSGNSQYQGAIADRADGSAYAAAANGAIIDNAGKDVAVQVVGSSPPVQYIAIGTDNGMSVVGKSTLAALATSTLVVVYDYAANANDNYTDIALTSGGELYGANTTAAGLDRYDNVQSDSADQASSADVSYTTSSTPALRSAAINDISITEGNSNTDYASNVVALGTDLGVETIHEHSTQASGYVEHAVRAGNAGSSRWSSRAFGGALGKNGAVSYVNVPTSTTLDYKDNFTAEAWFKTEVDPYNVHILNKYEQSGSYWGWSISLPAPTTLNVTARFGSTSCIITPTVPSVTGSWHHVAFVISSKVGHVYLDGVEYGTPCTGTGDAMASSVNFRVGIRADLSSTYTFPGLIDEVRISDTARYSANFTPSQVPFTPDANTMALYHFDEGRGQAVNDDSGNANHGTLGADSSAGTDDPLFVSPAIAGASDKVTAVGIGKSADSGQLLSFDGGDLVDDIPDIAFGGTAAISICTWAYPTSVTSTHWLVYQSTEIVLRSNGTSGEFILNSFSTNDRVTVASVFALNTWTHICGTYSSGGKMRLYANGAEVGSVSPTGTYADAGSVFIIGGYNSESWEGKIDDVRIYTKALSGAEVIALYNRGQGTTVNAPANLAGWWKFDESTGQTAADSSGNGNNANIGNTSAVSTDDPTWSTGSPVKQGSFLWVGTNGAGANDGAMTAISLATGRQVIAFTDTASGLPDLDVTALSVGSGGLALVGTEVGAWNPGRAGFPVDDTATNKATIIEPVRMKAGSVRMKGGTRVK